MTEFWTNKRVLVGGGCGFLGSYLVPELVEAGSKVTVVDNFDNGYRDNLSNVAGRIELIEADLREPSVCQDLTQGQDIVLNLAAKAFGLEYSRSHNGEMLVYNLLCTLPLLEAARQNHVERFVVVSSSCVYPDDAIVPTPELPVFTGNPEQVNEGYGWAKRVQELAGTYYSREYGMKVCTIRPFNPYGGNYRWKSESQAHVVPALVKRILDGEDPLRVWGSGKQKRNLLHASDAARVILAVIENAPDANPVNIGYDDDISIAGLVQLICKISGKHPRVEFDTSRPEGRLRKCAEATRLRQLTAGLRPKVTLEQGIQDMIEWYNRSFDCALTGSKAQG